MEISTEELREALEDSVNIIVENVKSVLESTPPELAADIIEGGILMTGGGSLLDGLDRLIEVETGIKVTVAEDSVECVVEGTGKILNSLNKVELSDSNEIILLLE